MKIENINYIFCSDTYLRKINRQYLNHDYFTDIITYDMVLQGSSQSVSSQLDTF